MVSVNLALALLLGGLYLCVQLLVDRLLGARGSLAGHVLATVATAVALLPARARLLTLANQLLQRQWQAGQELLRDVGAALSHAIQPPALAALLCEDLPGRLRIDGAVLWMLEPPEDLAFVTIGGSAAGAPLLAQGAAAMQVEQTAPTLGYLLLAPSGAPAWAEPFTSRGMHLVLPLCVGDRMVGMYACGAAQGGGRIPEHVLNLLLTLAPSIAAAIENARAYATIARLNDQLRALDRLKGEFIESVGHELRTPLTTLKLAIDMLEEERQVEPMLQQILRAGLSQLQTLVDQVLDFEGRVHSPEPESAAASQLIHLEPLADGLLASFATAALAKGLQLELAVDPRLGVWGLAPRLQRALREVLDNAVRYSPGGVVRLGATLQDGLALISVVDQGGGIPPDEQDQLFSAFYRGRGTRALSGTPGAGLGLSIARREVELLGGQIWLQRSGPGGSEICIALPALLVDAEERVVGR